MENMKRMSKRIYLVVMMLVLACSPSAAMSQAAARGATTAAPTAVPTPPVIASTTVPAATAPAPTNKDAGYVLGPDDVIEVNVLFQPEFKTQARIEADGSIALPFIGRIIVSGQTPLTLAANVGEKLRAGGYYTKPVATVDVASYASRYVVVLGEVANPGLQPINRVYHLSEIIARAGGIRPTGADFVVLRRVSGPELRLNFKKMATGSGDDDPIVVAGDKIFVPESEKFFVQGQVNGPGEFVLEQGMTVGRAIAKARGLTPLGNKKKITLSRNGSTTKVGFDKVVMAGDIIEIGERFF